MRGVPALLAALFTTLLAGLGPSREAAAIVQGDDAFAPETSPEVVIVNGSLSAPGAVGRAIQQRGPVASLRVPQPESFSAERLLSQHSLDLHAPSACSRQFCLVSETIDAQLLAQPEARYLVGLRFDSRNARNPTQHAPVNLVAVVDRSESMDGAALQLTKQSLGALVRQLTARDQFSIVTYGASTRTYFAPASMTAKGRKRVLAAIDRLAGGEGAATLEAGLSFGYRLARAAGNDFEGADRVMLFTDERPEGPDLAAALAAAEHGARQGVGLTTIGIEMPFTAQLATAIGSIHGANVVFVRTEAELTQVFGNELHTLLSELAHDVRINITPAQGYRIAGVYGVPGAQVQYARGQDVAVTIPTAFLGARAGQLFVTMAPLEELPTDAFVTAEPLARIALRYSAASSGLSTTDLVSTDEDAPEHDTVSITTPVAPSPALQLGRLLIDEFTTLRRASTAYHVDGDERAAFEHLHAFAPRLRSSRFPGLERERQLVNSLEEQLAFLAGRAADSQLVRSRISRLWGVWRVRSVQGRTDFRANERVEFTPDSKFRFFDKESGRHVVSSVASISTNRQQIVMDYSGVVYNYEVRGSELVLEERPGTLVFLQRSRLAQ
jgi:Ca-activated chloride channel homolog